MIRLIQNRKPFTLAITVFCCFLLCLLIGWILFTPQATVVHLANSFTSPSSSEWFGTDALGRSVLARTMSGASETVFPSLLVLLLVSMTGTLIGLSSGFIGGKFDRFILMCISVFQAFPSIVFVIAIVGVLGAGLSQTLLAICLTHWTKYAIVSRSLTLQLKHEPYIEAALMYGNTRRQILTNYYLPSLIPHVLTTASVDLSAIIMEIAGLSFIGLGAQIPAAEWGAMMSDGKNYIQSAPWIVLFPCLALIFTILLFTWVSRLLKQSVEQS